MKIRNCSKVMAGSRPVKKRHPPWTVLTGAKEMLNRLMDGAPAFRSAISGAVAYPDFCGRFLSVMTDPSKSSVSR
ncbi:hypothetical protein [Martelella sp. HB161492]|uniref:hypothetical protein n=1 Tax=Martelella sp. HB161492 TaxID=2720726 RepID=UPI001590917B|nr:hypothetical protein [Martelella sp. HB161492]